MIRAPRQRRGSKTAAISFRPTSGCCSGTTLPPLRARPPGRADPGGAAGLSAGTLWLIIGAVLGGVRSGFCDPVRIHAPERQIAGPDRQRGGRAGCRFHRAVRHFSILVILLAVIALVVTNALKASPWGTFTLAMTIPIAMLMGVYLRFLRPGKVLETSLLGFVLVMAAVVGGQYVAQVPWLAALFTFDARHLAWMIIAYGFAASVLPGLAAAGAARLPEHVHQAGTIFLLALGILAVRPTLAMPALTRFIDGTGPVFAGKIFPFCFYHDCLRRHLGISCADLLGNHPEADYQGKPGAHDRLWLHADGVVCRHHGHGCGVRPPARDSILPSTAPPESWGRTRPRPRRPSRPGDTR